jgi:hypothetical protein
MANRAAAKVFKGLPKSPRQIQMSLQSFSDNAGSFTLSKDEALAKYNNKWIAIYNGRIEAVADSLEILASEIRAKDIPASQTLFRHISPKDKVYIL